MEARPKRRWRRQRRRRPGTHRRSRPVASSRRKRPSATWPSRARVGPADRGRVPASRRACSTASWGTP
ncbi:MAG: hypothetical protein DMF78_07620 [Acidobacteria bacterium]|nr:MAG: hypothetical protein DMF78_07620 [Acidobacteriota bacterium]